MQGPMGHGKDRVFQMGHHYPQAAQPGWKSWVLIQAVAHHHPLSFHVPQQVLLEPGADRE